MNSSLVTLLLRSLLQGNQAVSSPAPVPASSSSSDLLLQLLFGNALGASNNGSSDLLATLGTLFSGLPSTSSTAAAQPDISALLNATPAPAAAATPAAAKTDTTDSKLLTDARKLLTDSPMSLEDLKGLKNGTAHSAVNEVVRKMLGITVPDIQVGNHKAYYSLVADSGVFKGQALTSQSAKSLADAGLISKWDLTQLEKELGVKGSQGADGYTMRFENLEAAVGTRGSYLAKPLLLSQAQKYLDAALKLEKEYGITASASASSSSSSGSASASLSSDSDDVAQICKDLREKAKACVETSVVAHSPLIFDEDGNNQIDLTSAEDGVQFDLNGDGHKEQVAWSQAKGDKTDGWLALDRNGNGAIDNGKELFGDQFGAANGYQELAKFDINADGKIDKNDAVFKELRVWKDTNHDGVSQADELVNLTAGGVESIDLGFAESTAKDAHGNELRQQASFTRTDSKAAGLAQQLGQSANLFKTGLSTDAWLLQK